MPISDQIKKLRTKIAIGLGGETLRKRLFGVGKEDDFFAFSEMFGGYRNTADYDAYQGIVYACITAIAEEVGGYEITISRKNGDNLDQLASHPFADLINSPQSRREAGISTFDLFEATQSFIELQGEAFWYLAPGAISGQPREIILLRPDRVGISIDSQGEVEGYFIRRHGMPTIPLEVSEVAHFKTFNPNNPYRGLSTIQAGLNYIETEQNTTKYTKNFFKNNAGLSGVLQIKGQVAQDAFKKFSRRWRERYEGVDNAGKVAILRDTDATFTKVGLGLNELDMEALRKITVEQVITMFRVPKALLGISDEGGLGRASVETYEYIFAKRVIEPKLQRIDAVLQRVVDKTYGTGLIVGHKSIVPADKEFALSEREKAVDKWLTRNEVREQDGMENVDGGDQLFVEFNKTPINLAPEASQSGLNGKKITIKLKRKTSGDEAEQLDYQRKENFRLSLVAIQERFDKKMLAETRKILESQRKEVLGRVDPKSLTSEKSIESLLFDLKESVKNFVDKLTPISVALAVETGPKALEIAGSDADFLITDNLKAALAASIQRMAHNFNTDTMNALVKTLTEGIAQGESLNKLAGRVNSVYTEARGFRAIRIAQTETIKASNLTTIEAYKQTGYVTSKRWFANPGHCSICAGLDGTEVGLTVNFANVGETLTGADGESSQEVTYEDIAGPPAHPNCRCTVVPVR